MQNQTQPFLLPVKYYTDHKGGLGAIDDRQLPFEITRSFWLHQVPDGVERGGHAHKTSKQLLVCLQGVIEATLEDLSGTIYQFRLSAKPEGLYLPPMCWGKFKFLENAIALCFASDYFDEADYIREFTEFLSLRNAGR